jgi:hypothetical protein
MYGIRASLVNFLTHRGGVANILLQTVLERTRALGKNTVVVPWPLAPMQHVLKKYGFTEVYTDEQTPERTFLKPVEPVGHYFVYTLE